MLTEHTDNLNTWYILTNQNNIDWFLVDIKYWNLIEARPHNTIIWTQDKKKAQKFLARRSAEQFAERLIEREITVILEKN